MGHGRESDEGGLPRLRKVGPSRFGPMSRSISCRPQCGVLFGVPLFLLVSLLNSKLTSSS